MRMRSTGPKRLPALLVALALVVAACGDDDAADDATTDETQDTEGTDDTENTGDTGDDAEGSAAGDDLPENLELPTGAVGGSYYVVGNAIASTLESELGVAVTASATEGSGENIRLLDNGDVDIAMIAINALQPASVGAEPYEKEYDNLRVLLYAWAHPTVFVALEDSGLETVGDLEGKRVGVGPGAATFDHISGPMLEAHGVDYEALDKVYAGFGDAFSQVGDGRLDAAIAIVTGGRALIPGAEELAFQQDVTYLEFDEEASAQVIEETPYFFEATIDGDQLPGYEGDEFQSIDMGGTYFVVREDMSDETARALTEALHTSILEGADEVVFLEVAADNEEFMATPTEGVPFHAGAQQYWEEAGLWQG